MSHLRAVLSDPGIVQLPTTGLDFSDLHAGKTMPNLVGLKQLFIGDWFLFRAIHHFPKKNLKVEYK